MHCGITNVGKLLLFIAILHNYCINERELLYGEKVTHATVTEDPNDYAYVPSDVSVTNVDGNCIMRDILVHKIADAALSRPDFNKRRNK